MLYGDPHFKLYDAVADYGVMGQQLMYILGTGIQPYDPIEVYAPRKGTRVNMSNPLANFHRQPLYSPGNVFNINDSRYASSYIIASLDYAHRLFGYTSEVSAIELRLLPDADIAFVKRTVASLMGEGFTVKDRYEQQAETFKVVQIEKFISYLFLCFILMVACFNIIGSLSMLMIDKRQDIRTLRSLGATDKQISTIFRLEGHIISLAGALLGLLLGGILCWAQQEFGLVSMGGSEGLYIVDAYPVSVYLTDILLVLVTVLLVSWLAIWYPVNYLSKKILKT
jgi:lipoprotein-releasing system permease protein